MKHANFIKSIIQTRTFSVWILQQCFTDGDTWTQRGGWQGFCLPLLCQKITSVGWIYQNPFKSLFFSCSASHKFWLFMRRVKGILNRLLYRLWLWCGLRMNWGEQMELLTDRRGGNHFYSHTHTVSSTAEVHRQGNTFSLTKESPFLLYCISASQRLNTRWIWNTVPVMADSIIHSFAFPWQKRSRSTETLGLVANLWKPFCAFT